MRPSMLLLPLLATFTGCAVHAFTPPARPMPLSSMETPKNGEGDLQLDGTANGEPLGPGITSGNARYRRGVADDVAITGDLGFMRANGEAMGETPFAGTARVGAQVQHDVNGELMAGAFAGAGMGYAPAAGGWLSADVGVGFTGMNRHIRPTFVVDAYASQPFASETFYASGTALRLPRTFGTQFLVGFELGKRERAAVIGFSIAQLWATATRYQEAESQMFLGLGGGFRFGAI